MAALFSLLLLALPSSALAARSPVLVELFTAQGCAACDDANVHMGKLAERDGVLVLTFSVDYWDYLGWADSFARPEFAERQKAYVAAFALREPYTPQVVVNGQRQAPGVKAEAVDQLVRAAGRGPNTAPDIQFINPRRVDVGSSNGRASGEVWLVRYDPREQDVEVKGGENRGKTITHHNVVREIRRLGVWKGRPTAYRVPSAAEPNMKTVVIIQSANGGRVLAVGKQK